MAITGALFYCTNENTNHILLSGSSTTAPIKASTFSCCPISLDRKFILAFIKRAFSVVKLPVRQQRCYIRFKITATCVGLQIYPSPRICKHGPDWK